MNLRDCRFAAASEYDPSGPRPSRDLPTTPGLYVMKFTLEGADKPVAIAPARIDDVEFWGVDVCNAILSVLDADLREQSSGWAVFKGAEARIIGGLAVADIPVEGCYLEKQYTYSFDPQADSLLSRHIEAGSR